MNQKWFISLLLHLLLFLFLFCVCRWVLILVVNSYENGPNIWLGPELNDNVENKIKNFSIDKSYRYFLFHLMRTSEFDCPPSMVLKHHAVKMLALRLKIWHSIVVCIHILQLLDTFKSYFTYIIFIHLKKTFLLLLPVSAINITIYFSGQIN